MPSLMAIIGANADPMRKELEAVQRMAKKTRSTLETELNGGHAKSGVIRETMVLLRELGRGNYSRVPGSLSILLGQLGILKLLTGDNAKASRVLADAWGEQSAKASLAAVSATRKAAASELAFAADESETGATLEAAIADKYKMDAAIENAAATEKKASAARDAAEAEEMEAGAAAASVGILGTLLGIVVALGGAYYIWSKHVQAVADAMAGVKLPDLGEQDLGRLSATEAGYKKIADAINEAADAYDSVAASADRHNAALKVEQETAKALLEIQKQRELTAHPNDKAAIESKYRGIELNQQKQFQAQDLQAMIQERDALAKDAASKKSQADSIKVSSSGDASSNETELKKQADAAKEHLKTVTEQLDRLDSHAKLGNVFKTLEDAPADYWKYGEQMLTPGGVRGVHKQLTDARDTDYAIIGQYDKFQKNKKPNESLREYQQRLYGDAAKEAGRATTLSGRIQDQPGVDALANAHTELLNQSANTAAKQAAGGRSVHGHVNSLQQIGAYTSAASHISSHQNPGKNVENIDRKMDRVIALLSHTAEHGKTTAENTKRNPRGVQY